MFGKTVDEEIENLSHVLDHLNKAGLKTIPHKCHLLKQARYLGDIVSEDGVFTHSKIKYQLCNSGLIQFTYQR